MIVPPAQEEVKQEDWFLEENRRSILEGKYIVKKKIAEGGFGKVYRAFDKYTNEFVIIKVNAEAEMNKSEFKIT